ncbi:putative nuclease HARBI1 [Ornithodoros turicata]|uniref:putative nuclease HARBI1 n=1 Tax=Ornithodoros turicata TaxID=34597 RepID=UPI0031399B7C
MELRELNKLGQLDDFESYSWTRTIGDRLDRFRIWSGTGFKRRYRFSKDTVRFIIETMRPDVQASELNCAIAPELQVLSALRFFAKGCYQYNASDMDRFSHPIQSGIVQRVAVALASRRSNFIKFPLSLVEEEKAKNKFQRRFGFPLILGVIDGTHVRIKSPSGQTAQMYVNRKGYHSLNVQVPEADVNTHQPYGLGATGFVSHFQLGAVSIQVPKNKERLRQLVTKMIKVPLVDYY